jgi:predicted site-specific integrase-resolvase
MTTVVQPSEAAKYYNISIPNLRKLAREGKVPYKLTPGGHYRYPINIDKNTNEKRTDDNQEGYYIYARVSSRKQKNDLERQVSYLKSRFPGYKLITDIGSGINYERKGFKTILEQLFERNIKRVVVAHKDRFTRFSFEFFQWLFQKFGGILESVEKETGKDGDFIDDIMEVFTVFTARYHGRRKYKNKNTEDSDSTEYTSEEHV